MHKKLTDLHIFFLILPTFLLTCYGGKVLSLRKFIETSMFQSINKNTKVNWQPILHRYTTSNNYYIGTHIFELFRADKNKASL